VKVGAMLVQIGSYCSSRGESDTPGCTRWCMWSKLKFHFR